MKRYMLLLLFPVVFFWLPGPGQGYSHGVHHAVKEGRAVVISVMYDDNDPMSFADYRLYAPGDGKTEFQNGRTDKKGRFSFLPDAPGDWRIKLGDGMGHGVDIAVKVTPSMTVGDIPRGGLNPWQKALMGFCVLWGALGTALYFRKRG